MCDTSLTQAFAIELIELLGLHIAYAKSRNQCLSSFRPVRGEKWAGPQQQQGKAFTLFGQLIMGAWTPRKMRGGRQKLTGV